MMTVRIDRLDATLASLCETQFARIGWQKPDGYFAHRLQAQDAGTIAFFVARDADSYIGHVLLHYRPAYPGFNARGIPEIQDLNVMPSHRRRGIGGRLIERCERLAARTHREVGIGFGLYGDYGAAQRIYVARGYVPDGTGVHYAGTPVVPGANYPVDDDLVLYLTRSLDASASS